MTRKLLALAVASTMALTAAPAVNAMEGLNMLTGAVFNSLRAMNLPTDNIDQLTLAQIAQIKNLVDGGESEGTKRQRIKVILDKVQG